MQMNKENRKRCLKKARLALLAVCMVAASFMVQGEVCLANGGGSGRFMNASGNLNIRPAVDPIGERGSFSAVLYNNRNGLPPQRRMPLRRLTMGLYGSGVTRV